MNEYRSPPLSEQNTTSVSSAWPVSSRASRMRPMPVSMASTSSPYLARDPPSTCSTGRGCTPALVRSVIWRARASSPGPSHGQWGAV